MANTRVAAAAASIAWSLVAFFFLGDRAFANVTLDGDVLLYDTRNATTFFGEDPFTAVNDGIPLQGNIIEGFRGIDGQVRFEGRVEDMGTADPADDENDNFHIIVGRSGTGQLSILGGSDLRDMDLVIGDSATTNGGQLRFGTGIVRIDGEGSLYNNDPGLLPYFSGQDPDNPSMLSVNPRAGEADAEDGFDLWVGRAGNGALQITAGGRAEIHDTLIIGDEGTATGIVSVDGFNSFLGTGGFDEPSGTTSIDEYGGMIVGHLGTGLMNITNGAQVVAMGRQRPSNEPGIAAVLGSNPYDFEGSDNNAPESGGIGTVRVDGAGSKWIVGGTLQVGGFHNSEIMSAADVKGIAAVYGTNVGRGTLNVTNDGLVNLIYPREGMTASNELFALAIGRFGRVTLGGELGDGRILLSSGFENSSGGNDPDPLLENSHLINDGLVTGSGYIGTGRLLNRSLGVIQTGVGQTMVIDARGTVGEFEGAMLVPLQNYGVVRAIGSETGQAEFEFIGAAVPPTDPMFDDLKFLNGRLTTADITNRLNNGRTAGLIHAQHGTLHFRSGLLNQGEMAFTAGNNIVSGHTTNSGADAMALLAEGVIAVSGNETMVTFEDDLMNDGTITVDPGTSINVLGNLGGSGTVSLAFGSSASGINIGHISVGGDAVLGGTLEVSLGPGSPSFMNGDAFEILSAAGQLGMFATHIMPILPGNLSMFPDYDPIADTLTLRVGTSNVATTAGDYNNDGKVDAADYVVWRDNLGQSVTLPNDTSPGSVTQFDYGVWRANFGQMAMPGSASGAAVPEPATLALTTSIAVLALMRSRRRC